MGFAPRQLVALRENKQLRPESPGIFDNRFDQFLVRDFMKGPRVSSLQRKRSTRRFIQVQVEAEKLRRFNLPNGFIHVYCWSKNRLWIGHFIHAVRSAVQPLKRPTDSFFQGILLRFCNVNINKILIVFTCPST